MKWVIACFLALFMVSAALAGEDPYIAIVGNDALNQGFGDPFLEGFANPFYFSQKHQQFLFDQTLFSVPVCFGGRGSIPIVNQYTRVPNDDDAEDGCEQFRANTPINQPEVCDVFLTGGGGTYSYFGEPNARITARNEGFYEWYVRLPKKPSGEINLVLECGILKPNAFTFADAMDVSPVELCAAETGERIGAGLCVRQEVNPGTNPLVISALPRITAIVYPGPFSVGFAPFNLTAFRNPSTYTLTTATSGAMENSQSLQVLDGTNAARILLKACMDKTIVAKLPVTGQLNALGQAEHDLEAGDLVYVRLFIPRDSTVDIYCNAQSLRVAGVGESPF